MYKCVLVMAAIVLLGTSATVMADEKAEKAIQELDKNFAKVKTYTCTSESTTDASFGPAFSQKSKMVTTSQWMRKGDNVLMKAETKGETTKTMAGETTTTPSTMTTVDDGKFMYVLTVEGDQKTVMKSKTNTVKSQSPSGYFANFKAYFDIKLLDDQKIDGEDCFVFELKMKPMEGAPPVGRQVVCYQKANGIVLKSESFDGEGKLIASSITKDVKINPEMDPKQFTFEVPEGAQVMDTTATPTP
ncbi:MAG: outer membrane lipoprotein carrier protein LolA [Phycisphaerae bacterium]|nr:outer membrane lipoprotein carrier protein LolA [Phycisphaerae bacterium]